MDWWGNALRLRRLSIWLLWLFWTCQNVDQGSNHSVDCLESPTHSYKKPDSDNNLAIFSSPFSLGSIARDLLYISCTSLACFMLSRIHSCRSGTGLREYGTFWYCWMSRITSAVLKRFVKLMSSVFFTIEGIPSSMKVKSVR